MGKPARCERSGALDHLVTYRDSGDAAPRHFALSICIHTGCAPSRCRRAERGRLKQFAAATASLPGVLFLGIRERSC